jgi:hypothetical protein
MKILYLSLLLFVSEISLMLLDFLSIEDFEIEAQSCLFSLTQIKKIGALNEVQGFFEEEEH